MQRPECTACRWARWDGNAQRLQCLRGANPETQCARFERYPGAELVEENSA